MGFIKKEKNTYLYLLVFIFLLIITNFYFFDFLKDRVYSFFYNPLYETFKKINFNNNYNQEPNFIYEENKKLISELAEYQIIKEENQFLRETNKIKDIAEKEKILVSPIFLSSADILVIDKGFKQGVREKMIALNKNGYICGSVDKITDNFSYLKLLSGIEFKLPVKIKSFEEETNGILIKKNKSFLINLIPQNKKIAEGDMVFSKFFKNENFFIPENILLGKVVSVKRDDISSFQEIEIILGCMLEENYLILLDDYGEI